jgi:hypothetical protein
MLFAQNARGNFIVIGRICAIRIINCYVPSVETRFHRRRAFILKNSTFLKNRVNKIIRKLGDLNDFKKNLYKP